MATELSICMAVSNSPMNTTTEGIEEKEANPELFARLYTGVPDKLVHGLQPKAN